MNFKNFLKQGVLDLLPLLALMADWRSAPALGAAAFHATLAEALGAWIEEAMQRTEIRSVALAGGCLSNGLLRGRLCAALQHAGIEVLLPVNLPPNDGAISVGQAWVALCHEED